MSRNKSRSYGNNAPAGENSTYVQHGEPEEVKLMRALRRAGTGAAIAGGAAGAGLAGASIGEALEDQYEASLPAYNQPKTVIDHAQYYGALTPNETPEDYMMVEGVRQALLGGRMEAVDVDRMAIEGKFNSRQLELLGDIHDFGASGLSHNPMEIAAMIAADGGDGNAYLQSQQIMRDEMGIDVPMRVENDQ